VRGARRHPRTCRSTGDLASFEKRYEYNWPARIIAGIAGSLDCWMGLRVNNREATARSGKTRDGVREYGHVIKSSAVNADETDLAAEYEALKPETACQ
jgi:hypothetical protein